MTINLTIPKTKNSTELKPRISVIGVGGAGGNAVNNMIQMGLEGVEFIVANSDAQALAHSAAERKIQMGAEVTKGLGAGSNPDIGHAAAEESLDEILTHLHDVNMVFVTAGLGGGTGTGASPVIAKMAREHGILTVGVVTKPFQFEGANRMNIAEAGLEELQQYVDTLLIIPNQNLFRVANENTTFADAFKMADDVLYSGVRGVTDLMVMPGLINLDFADIRSVMSEMGKAMMGTGEAEGERRAIDAAEAAIANPLLDDTSMSGAKGVLINITAGKDITLFEVDEAANRIRDEVEENANIIFGSTFEESLEGSIRVSVVATGIEAVAGVRAKPILHKVTDMSEEPASISAPVGAIGALEQPATQQLIELENTEEKAVVLPGKKGNEPNLSAQNELIECHDEPKKETTETTKQTETVCGTSTDEVFIPAPPVEGELGLKPSANPFAVADMINAGVEKTQNKAPKKKGISLIERVTRVALGDRRSVSKNQISRIEPEIKEHSEDTSVQVLDQLNGEPEKRLKDEPSVSKPENETPIEKELDEIGKDLEQIFDTTSKFEPKTLSEQAKVRVVEQKQEPEGELEHEEPTLLKRVNANDGLSVDEEDADLLEIPAFLRRQAN